MLNIIKLKRKFSENLMPKNLIWIKPFGRSAFMFILILIFFKSKLKLSFVITWSCAAEIFKLAARTLHHLIWALIGAGYEGRPEGLLHP